ncbi:MAG TPA: GntR family transcriptional regulator, partial [Rhizomicrobium sp.]|nr:GntR family transcriptional regulator [Rhizomicrobium sp.]
MPAASDFSSSVISLATTFLRAFSHERRNVLQIKLTNTRPRAESFSVCADVYREALCALIAREIGVPLLGETPAFATSIGVKPRGFPAGRASSVPNALIWILNQRNTGFFDGMMTSAPCPAISMSTKSPGDEMSIEANAVNVTATLKTQVAAKLYQAILAGEYAPGDRLNEAKLADEYKTSRIPIREALIELQHSGLVMNLERRGMCVTKLSEADMQRINSVRL